MNQAEYVDIPDQAEAREWQECGMCGKEHQGSVCEDCFYKREPEYRCRDCQREIPQSHASWTMETFGLMLCGEHIINRPTIAERVANRRAEKQQRKWDSEFPALAEALEAAHDIQQRLEAKS